MSCRRRRVAARRVERARLHQGDALLVVHDVQRLALERDGVGADRPVVLAVDLEAAEVDALFSECPAIFSVTLRTRWPAAS